MLDFAIQCLSVSLSIALGIVFIYGGCKAINWLFEGRIPCGTIKVKNFIGDGSPVDVKLSDGQILTDQQFVGFADFGSAKDVPYEFKTWLVLQSPNGRSFIKPQTVRTIAERKQAAGAAHP